jgi:MmyB-like transcription regulator ligand binding domain
MTNDAAPRFFNHFTDMASREGPRNMLHLIFDPQGLRPFVADWDTVSRSLLQRVYRESVGHVIDDGTRRLLDELLAYPDVPRDWKVPPAQPSTPTMPVVPLGFVSEGEVLRYFSLVTSVGTPQTVAAQELRLECMFPVDDATEARHRQLLAAGSEEGLHPHLQSLRNLRRSDL